MPESVKEDKKIEKKHETSLLKHSSQLAEIPLRGFTALEIDLFFGLCYFLQGQEETEVTISFSAIRELLGIERRGNMKLLEALDATSDKFGAINLEERTRTSFRKIKPFIGFAADAKVETFTVQAHKDFVSALNYLDGSPGKRYTLSDVRAIARVKSIFSKQALKMMFVYRNTGYWDVTIENLRYYLSIPPGYKQNDVKRRVIDVIDRELNEAEIFEFLEITENKEEGKKKSGRKKVLGYTFHFRFLPDENLPTGTKKGKEKDVSVTCPKCGRPLYIRKRKSDGVEFFGHKDGHRENALCRFTMSVVESKSYSIEESDNGGDGFVSKGDLEKYYRELREESKREAAERKETIRESDPEIYRLYEERERKMLDFVQTLTMMPLSEESRAKRNKIQSEVEKSKKALEEALEAKGYKKDYFEIQFRCKLCNDEGITKDGQFCSCRAERAAEAAEWVRRMKQK